jgi:hypothetical protein
MNYAHLSQKIPVAIILDQNHCVFWQLKALEDTMSFLDVKWILQCQNTKFKRNYFNNAVYYALNFFTLKNLYSRLIEFPVLENAEILPFYSEYCQKNWQIIPRAIYDKIESNSVLIIKFGMGLLQIPDNFKIPVFSFHHGDPEVFRGRPAGFYEILQNASSVGIIVQQLSNQLDAGIVYARAYSKIIPYSYRKTSEQFFLNSIPLLKKAILNWQENKPIILSKLGQNYRLPNNFLVIRFLFKLWKKTFQRWLYGVFYEKKWSVGLFKSETIGLDFLSEPLNLSKAKISEINLPYSFYADPFFKKESDFIYVEALNRYTGLGEIIALNSDLKTINQVILKGAHYSYPQSIIYEEKNYLLPEMSTCASQVFINGNDLTDKIALKGLEHLRLIDATHCYHEGVHYIFSGIRSESSDALFLFFSDQLEGPYRPHPFNPIVVDPACARMAGELVISHGKLYRMGQDNTKGYGEALYLCSVDILNPAQYAEHKVQRITCSEAYLGPHTLNIKNNEILFDFYENKFSWLAGVRRFWAKCLSFYYRVKM